MVLTLSLPISSIKSHLENPDDDDFNPQEPKASDDEPLVHVHAQHTDGQAHQTMKTCPIYVHVHGPTVLGFGGFHGFDGQACTCTQMDRPIKP